jgi:prophage maintenance system killer protein
MKYWIEELEKINKKIEPRSRVKNPGSLEFAAESATRTKDWKRQLAYLLRAIVVDHAFEDGNKRTGAIVTFRFFEANGIPFDARKVDQMLVNLAKKSVTDIEEIRRLIHDATI